MVVVCVDGDAAGGEVELEVAVAVRADEAAGDAALDGGRADRGCDTPDGRFHAASLSRCQRRFGGAGGSGCGGGSTLSSSATASAIRASRSAASRSRRSCSQSGFGGGQMI